MYFCSVISSRSSLTPYPPKFISFSLCSLENNIKTQIQTNPSQKHKNKNKNKQAKRPIDMLPKKAKAEKKVHKDTSEFFFLLPTTLGHGAYPGMCLIHAGTIIGESCFSLYQWYLTTDRLVVRGGTLCPLPLLGAGALFGWTLCRSCVLPQSLWIQMCMGPIVSGKYHFLGVLPSLWLLQFVCLFSLSLEGKGLMKLLHLGLRAPKFYSWHVVQL